VIGIHAPDCGGVYEGAFDVSNRAPGKGNGALLWSLARAHFESTSGEKQIWMGLSTSNDQFGHDRRHVRTAEPVR
jgi:hypothetical protein